MNQEYSFIYETDEDSEEELQSYEESNEDLRKSEEELERSNKKLEHHESNEDSGDDEKRLTCEECKETFNEL